MSTRSTVKFYGEFNQGEPIMSVNQHFDGYISGVGHELAKWLQGKKVINGICDKTMQQGFANTMACLAAQYVAEHKNCIGSFYMTTHDDVQDYNYKVFLINDQFVIEVDDIFKGTPDQLLNFNEEDE